MGSEGSHGSGSHGTSNNTRNRNARLNMTTSSEVLRSFGAIFEAQYPLFPLLQRFERTYPRTLIWARMAIELTQLLALAALPYHVWSFSLKGMLQALSVVLLPIYDGEHIAAGWPVTVAFFSAGVALLVYVLTITALGVFAWRDDATPGVAHLHPKLVRVTAHVSNALTSWAYVPFMSLSCSFVFCDVTGTEVYWHRSQACASGGSVALRVVAVFAMCVLSLWTLLTTSLMFDVNPTSRCPSARAHTLVDVYSLVMRGTFVVLWHYFASTQQLLYYSGTYAVAAVVLYVMVLTLLPHYRLRVNRAYAAIAAAAVLSAVLGCVSHTVTYETGARRGASWWGVVADLHIDTAIWIVLASAFALLGWFTATFRQSSRFVNDLDLLKRGLISDVFAYFPLNLPENDDAFLDADRQLLREFPSDNDDTSDSDAEDHGNKGLPRDLSRPLAPKKEKNAFHFTTPFLDAVYQPLDVELSTRTLVSYDEVTAFQPTNSMLAFFARLFFRGLRRFEFDPRVSQSFIAFMIYQARRMTPAHRELEHVRGIHSPLSVRYCTWKLDTRVRALLNLRTSGERDELLSRAKRHHRDVLQSIIDFWALLGTDDCDAHTLSLATGSVLTNKAECGNIYTQMLTYHPHNADYMALFAKFCEDVCQDPDAATQTKQCIQEIQTMRAAQKQRGAKAKLGVKESLTPLPLYVVEEGVADKNNNRMTSHVSTVRSQTVVFTFATLLLAVGFIVFYALFADVRASTADAVFFTGRLWALTSQTAAALQGLVDATEAGASTPVVEALRRQVAAATEDMMGVVAALTYGAYSTAYPDARRFRAQQLFQLDVLGDGIYLSSHGLLHVVAEATRSAAATPYRNSTVVQQALAGLTTQSAALLNQSLVHRERDAATSTQIAWTASIAFMALLVIAMFVAITQLIGSVHTVNRVKNDILTLFGYIRRDRLRTLHAERRRIATKFDRFIALSARERINDVTGEKSADDVYHSLNRRFVSANNDESTTLGEDSRADPNASAFDESQGEGAAAAAGGGATDEDKAAIAADEERILRLRMTSTADVDDVSYPSRAAQPFFYAAIMAFTLLVVGVAISLHFPTRTREDKLVLTTRLVDQGDDFARQVTSEMRRMQMFVASGDAERFADVVDGRIASTASLRRSGTAFHSLLVGVSADEASVHRANRLVRALSDLGDAADVAVTLAASAAVPAVTGAALQGRASNWTTVLPIDGWLRNPDVVSPDDVLPIRPRRVLGDKASDLARSPAERVALATSIAYSDAVRKVTSFVAAEFRDTYTVRRAIDHDDMDLYRAAVVCGIVFSVLALPLVLMIIRRENRLPPRLRGSWSVAVSLTIGALALVAVMAIGVWLAVAAADRGNDESAQPALDGRAIRIAWDQRVSGIIDDARSFVFNDGDPYALQRVLDTTDKAFAASVAMISADSGELALGSFFDVEGAFTAAGITRGIDRHAIAPFESAMRAQRLSQTAQLTCSIRLAFEAANGTLNGLVNTSRVRTQFAAWDATRIPDAVANFVRYTASDASRFQYTAAALLGVPPTRAAVSAHLASASAPTAVAPLIAASYVLTPVPAIAGSDSVRYAFAFSGATATPNATAFHEYGAYVHAATDTPLAAPMQLRLAASALLSRRAADELAVVDTTMASFVASWRANESAVSAVDRAQVKAGEAAFVACAAAALGFLVGAAVLDVLRISSQDTTPAPATASAGSSGATVVQSHAGDADSIHTTATTREERRNGSGVPDARGHSAFTDALEPAVTSLLLVVMLTVTGALVAVDAARSEPIPGMLRAATYREYVVAQAVVEARTMASPASSTPAVEFARERLERLVESSDAALRELYFLGGDAYVGLGRDATQDQMLFGVSTMQAALRDFGTVQSTVCASAPTTASPSYFMGVSSAALNGSTFDVALGVASAYDDVFIRHIRQLIGARVAADIAAATARIVALAPPLERALAASSAQYQAYATNTRDHAVTNVIGAAFGVGAAIVLYGVVVMVRFLLVISREEESGRTMIQLIPQHIVDQTPALQSFLENGSDINNSTSADTMATDNELAISEAISNMSTLPVISIDAKGTILKYTEAAERAFGFTAGEVTGVNVKLLMPPEVAENHDGYLSRYARTRHKHIIDTVRRTRAMRKSGEIFPVEVSVRELDLGGGEMIYIGFVRDMTTSVQLSLQGALNRYVLEMSDAAIIAIDDRGSILIASHRVTGLFGYARHELLRENVKMLMPSDVAMNHDGYLQRYRETGIKHIIDKTNTLLAQRKNGEMFKAELTVREIVPNDKGGRSTFVATISDVTAEHEARAQSQIHELISDLSPTPVIGISEDGTFVKFSRAASKLFGYSADELVGGRQNVQILMPDIYGNHDSFIASYRRRQADAKARGVAVESTVVGVTRKTLAIKRNRVVIPVEITVKEVVKEGVAPIFLAFVSDASEKNETATNTSIIDGAVFHSMVPVITITTKGTITQFNNAAANCFGYRVEEVMGQNVKMLMPESVAAKHDGYLSRYLDTRIRTVIDCTRYVIGVRKDGGIIPVELNVKEVAGTETSEAMYVGFARDVTVERNARQQFAVNNVIAELSTIPIITIDAVGTIKSFSRAAEEVFGYYAMEVIGTNVKVLMTKEIAKQHDRFLQRYHETGIKHVIDTKQILNAIHKDGHAVPVELSVREIKDPNGGQSSFAAFARDVTDDGVLAAQTQLGQVMKEQTPIPLIQISTDCIVLYANEAVERCFGFTAEELTGKNVSMLMSPELAMHHDTYVLRYLKGNGVGIVGSSRKVVGQRKDGTAIDVELTINEFKSDHTSTHFFTAYVRDISEQQRLELANLAINSITDMSSTPIIAIDSSGTVIKFSRAACNAFGYEAKAVLGNNVKMLMPKYIADKHDGYLRTYLKSGMKTVLDNTVRQTGRRKSGEEFAVELRISEIIAGDNKLFVGYARDATQDTMLEREMNQNQAVVELSSSPIITINREGTVQSMNKAGLDLFGYSRDEVIQQNVKMLMPKKVARYHDKFLKAYIRTGVKTVLDSVRQVEAQKKNGNIFPAQIRVREIVPTSGDKSKTLYVGYLDDLTERLERQSLAAVNQAVADVSVHPIISIQTDGTVLSYSSAATRCFGYTPEEVIGKNIKMLMPEKTATIHDQYLANFARKCREDAEVAKSAVDRYVHAMRKTGEVFVARILVRPVVSDAFTAYVGFIQDYTEDHKRTVSMSVCDFAITLCSAPIIQMEPNGIVRRFNAAAERCFGYTSDEVEGQNIKMLMPQEIAVQHDDYLKRYRETGVKHVIDMTRSITGKRKSGQHFPATVSVVEIKHGEQHYFTGYLRDYTQLQALATAQKVNESILECATQPFISIDAQGTILFCNDATQEMFGRTKQELKGENVKVLMPEPYQSEHDGYLKRYHETGIPKVLNRVTRNLFALHRDGSKRPIELYVSEIVDDEGVSTFIASFRDMTEISKRNAERSVAAAAESGSLKPIIVITPKGIIERSNKAASRLFGYSLEEVMGKNVKMLMPHDIAIQHDGFLSNYMRTGEKHVIDTNRRVVGQRKDGASLALELTVREITVDAAAASLGSEARTSETVADTTQRSNDRTRFLACIEDITVRDMAKMSHVLSDTIMTLLPTPVITINELGIIQSFNAAAETAFEFKARQVVGRNVSILMTEEHQRRHDGYLAAYRRTGIKHVIGTTREVVGESKSGKPLPISLRVQEVKKTRAYSDSIEQAKEESIYVGFAYLR